MKTPIELLIDGLSEISTIKITDIDAYSQLIKEVKHYEEQCIINAYEDGISKVLDKLEISSDNIWYHNYYNETFKTK